MKITKEKLNLEEGQNKEWIITNGIGGFSSSTVIGANTRKYHGLLFAPFIPPAKRYLILSKLEESIEIRKKKYDLYTNVCESYISHGYQYQEEFRKEEVPVFRYKVGKVEMTKTIGMEYGHNTVRVFYQIKNDGTKAKLTLAPIVNFRNFHQNQKALTFKMKQEIHQNKVKITLEEDPHTPIYMNVSEGKYIEHQNDVFHNMFYIEEIKRGLDPIENHMVPGVYEIEIPAKSQKEISFVCSLEENIEPKSVTKFRNEERVRLGKIFKESLLIDEEKEKKQDPLVKTYLIATDQFIVNRPNFGLHTIIAGYPWFLDWGRDTLISFEGLLLIPNRIEIAKEVLLTMVRDVKEGLVPNGYSEYDNKPLYNSVDASLLLFEQVNKYLKYTGDFQWIQERIYPVMQDIVEHYCHGIDLDDNNIYLDSDGLLVSGTPKTQNTWMDAKFDGKAVTPRNGKAVEVNSLWYNANKIMQELAKKWKDPKMAKQYKDLAEKCKNSFAPKFYQKEKRCLYDVIGDSKIRPNQLFSLSLSHPVIEPNSEMAKEIIQTVEDKLYNPYGLKTLAEGEENYVEVYEGSPEQRDNSYHQGITWPWLLGLYYDSLKNGWKASKKTEDKKFWKEKLDLLIANTKKTFSKEIYENGCLGGISELYDSKEPQLPKGAIHQAWSVAEVFRIMLEK